MERVILHLDMDAFFAAIEQRERPELRGKPVLIGRPGPRGVVATCSYEARRYGVRSAMPSVTAARLCPDAAWVRPRHRFYAEVSRRIFGEIVARHVPVLEQVSVDEAYGDLSGLAADLAEGAEIAERIRAEIRRREGLTASAGVAPCRFLAKVASDLEKPDGLTVLSRERFAAVVGPMPVQVIPGIGPKLARRLAGLGVRTVEELARVPFERLRRELGLRVALFLAARARGEDDTPVGAPHERKQVSEERTYRQDLRKPEEIERELLARADGVAAALRRRGLLARTVVLKVRDGAFRTVTRSRTLDEPSDLASDLYDAGRELLRDRVDLAGRGVRLLGLGARDLLKRDELPPPLFPDERRERERAAARAADLLRARFGGSILRPARLVDRPPDSRPSPPAPGFRQDPPAAHRRRQGTTIPVPSPGHGATGMREIEVKIEVKDADEARRRLGAAGAVALSPRLFEDNRVWDDREGSLRATRRLLRLRSAGGRHTLTFKRPPERDADAARYKVRIEHETTIGDPGEMERILEGLGYRVAWRYQKYRQTYRLEGIEIDLDETPLGVFLELEGPPEAIDRVARALGFGPDDYILATYRGLARERSGKDEPGDLVFPDDAFDEQGS